MKTTKLFANGGSQAVRLPKDCRFKGNEVYVKRIDNIVILISTDNPWLPMIKSLEKFTDDFMEVRVQPELEKRQALK
ncbi:AbrB/MazE/SpoVT family DNA-binding domain-containing protein [bacterium]|nr:AbrB/MazE/SpoVT family DNA-binding domain-containing protein [bacterium]